MARPQTRTRDLRDHVLATAIDLLEQEGPAGLRARRVADAAGTSTAAVHAMLGTKGDLARAMFSAGFARLDDDLAGLAETDDAEHDIVGHLAQVRAFAGAHPRLFELMFARPIAEFAPTAADWRCARRLHDRAMALTTRFLHDIGSPADPVDTAHALLALNRGLIAVERAGQLGRHRADRDRRWAHAVRAQLAGYRANSHQRP